MTNKNQLAARTETDDLEDFLQNSYATLRRIAQSRLSGHKVSLSATELVHEVYMKISEAGEVEVRDHDHFVSLASQCMRWVLADYARAKGRDKRGGGGERLPFDENVHGAQEPNEAAGLINALQKLRATSPRAAQVAELRYVLGLDLDETAAMMKVSRATVKRDWTTAKDFLSEWLRQTHESNR